MKQERIGFIGLGLMGKEMARHLLEQGYPLTVMAHRNREALEALCRDGASEVTTAAEMAAQSDIVFICVKTSEQVSDLVKRPDGLMAGARPGLVIVDCSTARPDITEQLADTLAPQDVTLIDAPLARTPREAREGRLNVMIGGEDNVVTRLTPIIQCFAENVFHVGPTGSAHKLKLINNFLSLGAAALAAEAASMAAALDVSQQKLLDICSQGGANSAMLAPVMEWVLERECTKLKFSLGNAEKDMRYLTETLATYQARSAMLPPLCAFLTRAKEDQGDESFVPTAYDSCVQK
ncbi:NAD(P)-dependent oxidoreductase [Halomonas sp. PAMB 3264]|uniref:NAD(P)-dependent oxidoreductase n=1 Tax=Halomonas sp. PAMB 3264 TaxID=3075222 RepID=UPI0028987413|nr:NAD(P)-dependent oxidoreductase [Halomonas sp. PAMB 3264]WNL41845.1 NAD(P)-dependent oxidoreductase [Halomonas sp. PAMB 3264]